MRLQPLETANKSATRSEIEGPIRFGDLTCFLVAGERALAGPSLAAAKEAVFELVMAQLDAQPLWSRLPRALHRADRAPLWPTVTSLDSLRRQVHITVL